MDGLISDAHCIVPLDEERINLDDFTVMNYFDS